MHNESKMNSSPVAIQILPSVSYFSHGWMAMREFFATL
jgi:hypothetical protein